MKKVINMTSNKLKIIAIISMILDHIGYYYYEYLNEDVYYVLRIFGRIAMPIFVFLIVKGYFNTKDFKRYLIRIFRLGITTQVIISILAFINIKFISSYSNKIYTELNILFSFVLILIFIRLLENILSNKNNIISAIGIFSILVIYKFIPIDYGYMTLVLSCVFYIGEKVKNNKTMNTLLLSIGMFIFLVVYRVDNNIIQVFSIFSLPIILLYNNELGKKSVKIQRLFYSIFPIQHFLIYSSVLLFEYLKLV